MSQENSRQYRRKKNEILRDRARISELLVRRTPIRKIAGIINAENGYDPPIKHPTIQRDINIIREEWSTTIRDNLTEARNRQLAELDEIEREAWREWERSKTDEHRSSNKVKGKPLKQSDGKAKVSPFQTEQTEAAQERLGDPRYMMIILKCQQRRADLLGLDPPKMTGIMGPDGQTFGAGAIVAPVVILPDNGRGPDPDDDEG